MSFERLLEFQMFCRLRIPKNTPHEVTLRAFRQWERRLRENLYEDPDNEIEVKIFKVIPKGEIKLDEIDKAEFTTTQKNSPGRSSYICPLDVDVLK